MKVLKESVDKAGNRRMLIELAPDESLKATRDGAYYKLGGQVEDIVQSHVVLDAVEVHWCSIGQEWRQ